MTEDPDKYHEEVAPVVFELRDPKHLLWRQDPRRLHLYPELPGAPSHVRVAAAWERMDRLGRNGGPNQMAIGILIDHCQTLHDTTLTFSRAYEPPEPLLEVLLPLCSSKPRYFVEAGAGPGKSSTTYMLEKKWNWPGMLIEPSVPCYRELAKQGRDAHLDASVLWSESNVEKRFAYKEYDALVQHNPRVLDDNELLPEGWLERSTRTVTLTEALLSAEQLHSKWIDKIGYMNINTVGAELQTLQGMDFSAYDVPVVSVAHHEDEPNRALIFAYMTEAGYTRLLKDVWSTREDWYVKNTLPTLKLFAGHYG